MKSATLYLGIIFLLISLTPPISSASNDLGLYFDEAATDNCHLEGLLEVTSVYLVLRHPSNPGGIGGWQGTMFCDEGVFIAGYTLMGQTINVGTNNNFVVGLGNPLPTAETVTLAVFDVLATVPGGLCFDALEGDTYQTPIYLAGDDYNTMIPMYLEYGGGSQPSLSIGLEDCPVSNLVGSVSTDSGRSWDGIKALFLDR